MNTLPASRHPGTSAASRLWSESAWVLPSMFTVSAFSVLVSLSLLVATMQPAIAQALRGRRNTEHGVDADHHELRSPQRAVAASAEGLLRRIDS